MIVITSQQPSDLELLKALQELEATWNSQVTECAETESMRTLTKQIDLAKQKKREWIAKNRDKKQKEHSKTIEKSNKALKRFFHPKGNQGT